MQKRSTSIGLLGNEPFHSLIIFQPITDNENISLYFSSILQNENT